MIADIYATGEKSDYDYYKWHDKRTITHSNQVLLPVYLRYNALDELAEFGFDQIWIEEQYETGGYVLGSISLDNLWSLNNFIEEKGIVVISANLLQNPQSLKSRSDRDKIVV